MPQQLSKFSSIKSRKITVQFAQGKRCWKIRCKHNAEKLTDRKKNKNSTWMLGKYKGYTSRLLNKDS